MASLLPLPDDPRLPQMIEQWPEWETAPFFQFPRSAWLSVFEDYLHQAYPQSSSRDRSLTARHYAPFALRDGPNVP